MKRAVLSLSRRHGRGFTLVEMVVALALLGMLAVLIFESLRFSQRSFTRTVQRGNDSWQTFAAQRLLRSLIENAYPQELTATTSVREPGLQGDERTIAITAPAPIAVGGGLYRYEIGMRPGAAGENDVVIRWRTDFAKAPLGDMDAVLAEEVLLDRVTSLQWSYQGHPNDLGDTDDGGWRDSWQDQRALPQLVRLRIGFAASDPRQWPDLIIAPRITDDANCVFDVVAQRCRREAS